MSLKLTFVSFILGVLFFIHSAKSASNCKKHSNKTCKECVEDFDCYYCAATKYCGDRPTIKPKDSECSGKWYAYKQCTVSGNLLLIIVPCVLGFLLLVTICCLYWCCCRKISRSRARKRYAKEDERRAREKEAREEKYAERAAERKLKHDEIRKKYGLFKDEGDGTKYQRFDVA